MKLNHEHFRVARLSEDHQTSLANFNCINEQEFLNLPSKKRKRIIELSTDMNTFLQQEAYVEQNAGLNNTFLLFNGDNLIGYTSLCADTIRLNESEQANSGVPYETVPAIKVARLAVDFRAQGQGVGKFLIDFSVYKAVSVNNDHCGVKFITLDCYPHRYSYYKDMGFKSNEVHNEHRFDHHPISLRLDIFEYLEK